MTLEEAKALYEELKGLFEKPVIKVYEPYYPPYNPPIPQPQPWEWPNTQPYIGDPIGGGSICGGSLSMSKLTTEANKYAQQQALGRATSSYQQSYAQ